MADNHNNEIVIFLDMDGVISDLEGHGRATGKFDENDRLRYDELDYQWWVDMPAFDGAKSFYYDLKKRGEVNFLTGPTSSAACHGGKAQWITNFVSKYNLMDLIICSSKKKKFIAGEGRILIDDRIANIKDWEDAGGIGILHEGDFPKTLAKLDAMITGLNSKPFDPKPKP